MCFEAMRMREAGRYIGRAEVLFIDLRCHNEYCRGHIPGARNFPYDETEDIQDWCQGVKELVSLYERRMNVRVNQIFIYCDRGNISLMAARDLNRTCGNIYNLYGGYLAWRGPVERTYVN